MFDLNDVALFVQVVKAGSFAEAARRVGIPPNTASRRIQQLEAQLGLRLLHRSTRRLTLTDAGEALYARSAEQVDALSAAAADLASDGQSPSGKVRVAAAADFFNRFQVEWVGEFLAAHPRIRLEFVLSDSKADLVAEGIDVAIRSGKSLDATLVARRLGSSRALLVASPGYLSAHGTPETPDDLIGHECIAMPTNAGRTAWRLDGPDGQVEVAVSGRFHANSARVLVEAALAGMGIGLLPEIMVAPLLSEGRLVEVMPGYGIDGIDLHLIYLSRRQQPRAVSAFAEFAVARLLGAGLVRPTAQPGYGAG